MWLDGSQRRDCHTRHTPDGLEVLEATSGGRTLVAELAPPPGPVPTTGSTAVGTAAVERFDHVCLATTTLQDTVALYRAGLGGDMVFGGANPVMGTTSSQIRLRSGPRIELLQPRRADAPIAGFLERHGPGLHHLTFYVADVLLAAQAARSAGFETTGTDVTSRRHWQETYLRPRTTCGLLVQLAWTDIEHTRPLTDDGIRAIHAGEVESFDNRMLPHPS
jgi:methylmalonyl-CoA/ethylmalonyl-CoA epimerase